MIGSLMPLKFTGDPLCHHTYWVSGSPPGWLRNVSTS